MIFTDIEGRISQTNGIGFLGQNLKDIKYQYKNSGLTGVRALFSKNIISKSDYNALSQYNDMIDSCVTAQTAFNRTLLNASPAAQKMAASANGGKVALQGLKVAEEGVEKASVGLRVANMALNAVIGVGIGLAISAAISGINKLIHYYDNLKEKSDEVVSNYKEQTEKLNEFGKKQENTVSRYSELSKGVDSFGNNVSLTTDEFEEFNQISNEVAELFPSLIQGYTSEGDAILTCKNNVDELTEAYKKQRIEATDALLNSEEVAKTMKHNAGLLTNGIGDLSVNSAGDAFTTFFSADLWKYVWEEITKGEEPVNKTTYETLKGLTQANNLENYIKEHPELYQYRDTLKNTLRSLDIDVGEYIGINQSEDEFAKGLYDLLTNKKNYDAISRGVQDFESNIKNLLSPAQEALNGYLNEIFIDSSNENYELANSLSNNLKSILSYSIQNIDSDSLIDIAQSDDMASAIKEYVAKTLNDIVGVDGLEAQIDNISSLGNKKLSKIAYDKYKKEAESFKKSIDSNKELSKSTKLAITKFIDDSFNIDTDNIIDTSKIKSIAKSVTKAQSKIYKEAARFGFSEKELKDANDAVGRGELFGNIDLDKRAVLEWTDKNIKLYKDALESWGLKAEELKGSYSTVLGDIFNVDPNANEDNWENRDRTYDIAFSPMLQTEDGAELLTSDTVSKYINALLDKAKEDDGSWTNEELLKLDAEGLEIDGKKIQGLIADIGKTAEATSTKMHFLGRDGALADAMRRDTEASEKELKQWDTYIAGLSEEDRQIAYGIYMDSDDATYSLKEFQNKMENLSDYELSYYSQGMYSDLELITQGFNNATEAKNNFDKALEGVVEYDTNFNSYVQALKTLQTEFDESRPGSVTAQKAADYLFGEGFLDDHTVEQVQKRMDEYKKIFDTWKDDDNKEHNTYGFGFLEQLEKVDLSDLNSSITKYKDGSYDFFIDPREIDTIAEKMNLTTDEVWACIDALRMMGGIDLFDKQSFDDWIKRLQETDDEYKNLKGEMSDGTEYIDVDKLSDSFEDTTFSIKDCKEELDDFVKNGGKLVNLTGDVDDVTESLKSLGIATGKEHKIKIDVDNLQTTLKTLGKSDEEIGNLVKKLEEANEKGKVKIEFTSKKGNAQETLDKLKGTSKETSKEIKGVQDSTEKANNEKFDKIKASTKLLSDELSNARTAANRLSSSLDSVAKNRSGTISIKYKTTGATGITGGHGGHYAQLNGTAHLGGISYNYGAPKTETALMGEVAPEMWVHARTGRWELVDKPQFARVEKGDVIFNGKQTKELLSRGSIDSFGKSYLGGTAYIDTDKQISNPKKTTSGNTTSGNTTSGKTTSGKTTKKKDKLKDGKPLDKALEKLKNWFEKLIDWIEIKLKRQTDRIDRYVDKAERAAERKGYDYSNKQYKKAISETNTQISNEREAQKEYNSVANRVLAKAVKKGIIKQETADAWKKNAKKGKLKVSDAYGKKRQEALKEYLEYYNKSIEAEKAILELQNKIADYSNKIINNLQQKYKDRDERTEAAIDLLKKQVENAKTATDKNKLLVSIKNKYNKILKDDFEEVFEYSGIVRERYQYIDKHSFERGKNYKKLKSDSKKKENVDKYIKKAVEYAEKGKKIPSSVLDKLAEYVADGYVKESFYSSCVRYNDALEAKKEAQNQAKIDKETIEAEKIALGQEAFDNVKNSYESRIKNNNTETSAIQSLQSYTKARHKDLQERDYNFILERYLKKRKLLGDEHESLIKRLENNVKTYGWTEDSDEYRAAENEINSVFEEFYQLETEIIELKETMRDDVYWRTFERAHDAAKRLSDVLAGINDLISDDMMFDSNGNATQYAAAQLALLSKELETARKDVVNYSDDIQHLKDISAEFYTDNGELTQEYVEKLKELEDGYLSAMSAVQSLTNEVIEYYKTIEQKELDALFKVIDARKEALDAKKDYYDYDKTLKDKNKDVQFLQAQLSALEGVEGLEARAKRAQLQAKLSEAQDALDDTIKQHEFDLSSQALDGLKDTLQESFDDRWKDIHTDFEAIQELLDKANIATGEERKALNDLLSFYGGTIAGNASVLGAAQFATGVRSVPHNMRAWTQDGGREMIIRKSDGAILTPLSQGDSVIPNGFTENLFAWGKVSPTDLIGQNGKSRLTGLNIQSPASGINIHYDSLLNVEGNVDSTVVSDLEKFARQFYKGAYEYTKREIVRDARKVGVK